MICNVKVKFSHSELLKFKTVIAHNSKSCTGSGICTQVKNLVA